MSLVLANALLLPFAALLVVPLLVHLFARARPPVYEFSAVEFLRRILRQSIRLKRPQSLLVLLLRTLLCAALIGLFLKPILFGDHRPGAAGAQRNVVVLVDATASMAAVEGTQTRFAAACARASEVLSELSANDLANVIWLGSPNRAEFPQLGVNVGYLKKVLRSASVTSEAADLSAALALAADQLQGKPGAREIYIVSDFQSSAWGAQPLAAPPGLAVHPIKIGRRDPGNQTLTALSVAPPNPLPGQEVTVACEVWNFSPEHSLSTLFLRAGDTPQTREVRLAPWQKATILFRVTFEAPGERAVTAALSEDAFPYDNERWATLEVVEHLRVGLFEGDRQTAGYWRRALEALDWVELITLEEARLGDFDGDALFLAGWKARETELAPVKSYLSRGGLVIWSPAAGSSAASLAGLTARSPGRLAEASATLLSEKLPQPLRLTLSDRDNPVFKVFAGGVYGDPTRATFKARLRLPAAPLAGGASLLNYEDGHPALVLFQDQGRLLLWNLPLQREVSDWAALPEFVPLLGELLFHYRRRGAPGQARRFVTGQNLAREFEGDVLEADVRLEFHGQPLKTIRRAANQRTVFTTSEARWPGLYAWHYRGALVERQAVNFPVVESDLRTQGEIKLGTARVPAILSEKSIRQLNEGTPLWPQLLLCAAVFALIEGLVLARRDRL
jgi:hypothetical protein